MLAPSLRKVPLWILLAAGVVFGSPEARASCGAESCALDNFGFTNRARRMSLEVAYQFVDQDRARIGTHEAQVGEKPGHHDEVQTRTNQVTVKGQLTLTPRWTVTAAVPYLDRLHSHITNEEGFPSEFKTWRFNGVGDATVLASWFAIGIGTPTAPFSLALQAGAKVPTGSRHVGAIEGEEPEPHARLGTGSWDLLVGGHAMHFFNVPTLAGTPASLPLFASVTAMHTGRGTDDYRVGRMLDAIMGTSYPLVDRLRLLGQVNLRVRDRDDPGVETHADEHVHDEVLEHAEQIRENTGGTSMYATPGLRFDAGLVALNAYVQLPLYQRVNGIQIVAPYHFWLGATYKLP